MIALIMIYLRYKIDPQVEERRRERIEDTASNSFK